MGSLNAEGKQGVTWSPERDLFLTRTIMGFKEIAEPLAKMGVPMTPVRPGTKRAFLPDFPTTATTDINQIHAWDKLYSDCNGACVARAEEGGVWFFEVDSADVLLRLQKETGQTIPDTFKVRSRPGRGHFYFRQTRASMAMGNISQTYVVGQDWSVRTNREYVVGPGSIHPDTKQPYTALNWGTAIAEAPDWLINWLISQKIQKQTIAVPAEAPRNERGLIPHGAIHGYMLTEAGRLRNLGLGEEAIRVSLRELVEKNCQSPIDWGRVDTMAKSICNFPAGENKTLALTQAPQLPLPSEPEETISFETIDYPIFPHWVMKGTSIYEGLAKPYCDCNSRIDYFMWMPCAAMMMNFLGTKVNVWGSSWKPSFYIVLIGRRGQTNKSSSIKDAIRYLNYASVLSYYSKSLKNADGKSIVWEAGSAEGLGTDMMRINCKNAILFYDELSGLVSKARIEGSSLYTAILKMYDSNSFSNSVKTKKDAFEVEEGTYCGTLITSTTDKKFMELWSQLAGEDTGLNDRFTWVLEPKELPKKCLEQVVNYNEGALITRKFIDKAVEKKTYNFFDKAPLMKTLEMYDNRAAARAEKWALYFAIDLGLPEIDEDCVERGIEIVKYEYAVKDYLEVFEAKNDESQIQQGTLRLLRKNGGLLEKNVLIRALNYNKYGLSIWNKAYFALVNNGYIVEEGKGHKGDPRTVRMLREMKGGGDD
jgi:bifunctional DNA primase/polymerase-like protein